MFSLLRQIFRIKEFYLRCSKWAVGISLSTDFDNAAAGGEAHRGV